MAPGPSSARAATTLTPGSPPTAVAFLEPFLAVGEGGQVSLLDLREPHSLPTRVPLDSGTILALGLREHSSGLLVAAAVECSGSYRIKLLIKGRLRNSIRTPHRSPPSSLAFSPRPDLHKSIIVSVSSSELILVDVASGTCTWALRGPAPAASSSSTALSQVLWCPSANPDSLQFFGIFTDGDICLWSLATARQGSPVELQWRAGPKDRWQGSGKSVGDLSRDGAYLVTTFPPDDAGEQAIMVWDVEDRSLARKYTVPLSSAIVALQVIECSALKASLVVSTSDDVFLLDLDEGPAAARELNPLPRAVGDCKRSIKLWKIASGDVAIFSDGQKVHLYDPRGLPNQIILSSASDSIVRSDGLSSYGEGSVVPETVPDDSVAPPPTLEFDPAWLSAKPQNNAKLKKYLSDVGSFPQSLRPAIYSKLLNCPSSPTFFTLLGTEEDAPLLAAFRSEWELEDWLAQSRMESLIHLLRAHGFEYAPLVDRVPPLTHGFVTLFAEKSCSLQQLFEISLSVLLRWGRMWWDESVLPEREVLFAIVEGSLCGHAVLDVFGRTGVNIGDSLRSVGYGLLNGFLPLHDWIIVVDHIVTRDSTFLPALLAAVLIECEPELAALDDADTAFFRRSHHLSVGQLVATANAVEADLRGTELERRLGKLTGLETRQWVGLDVNYGTGS